MPDALRVVVPSPGLRTTGTLRQAAGARAGVLVLNDTGTRSSLAGAICAEVVLYLHAAGLNTLSLSLPAGIDIGARASHILGGVSALRSLHTGKIVLITSAPRHPISPAEAGAESLSTLMELALHDPRSLPEVIRVVRGLTTTVREVTESVVGVAMLLAQPDSSSTNSARFTRSLPSAQYEPQRASSQSSGNARARPAVLLLPLPAAIVDDAGVVPRMQAQTVSRLYTWALSLVHPEGYETPESPLPPAWPSSSPSLSPVPPAELNAPGAFTAYVATARTDWRMRLRWADEQWAVLLADLTIRDPARGAQACAASARAGHKIGHSLRAARLAWPYVGGEERQTWLRICSELFQEKTRLLGGVVG